MATSKPYYQRAKKKKRGFPNPGKVIAIGLAIVLLVASGIVFVPKLVHHCDNCDKFFLGTGYYANVVSNALSSLNGKGDKVLCRDCAESNHALEILAGKSLEDFRRPLFEKDGD